MSPTTQKPMATAGAKAALAPKLRFPEFRDAEPWKPVSLGKASTPITERVGERKFTPVSISAGMGFVPQAEKFGRDISGNQYQLYTLVSDGDFVYNKGNSLKFPQGCVYQLQGWGQVAAPNVFICFRLKSGYSDVFFQNCFEQNMHGKQLQKHITSGARSNGLLNISKDHFFDVEIPTPSPAEQQKIADCLSSLDELIAAQGRKVEALKTHKKGLMQHLFPREGETQPQLRLPEFHDQVGWTVSSIQELIDKKLITGHLDGNHGSLYPRADEFSDSGIPYISATNFSSGRVDFRMCRYFSKERASQFKKGIARDGDILFAHNATVGPVAKLTTEHDFVILSTSLTYFRCNPTHLSNNFLQHSLVSQGFVDQCARVMSQSTRNQVPITTQRTFNLQIPSLPEQTRIADCLTSLDDLITAATQTLDTLKTHKQGLMQQLFPSTTGGDAMEGKS